MNLDSFWSRTTETVNGHRGKLEHGIRLSRTVGLEGPYTHEGPIVGFLYAHKPSAVLGNVQFVQRS